MKKYLCYNIMLKKRMHTVFRSIFTQEIEKIEGKVENENSQFMLHELLLLSSRCLVQLEMWFSGIMSKM